MKRAVGPLSPNMSNGKRNAFARRKFRRTVDPPPVANARSQQRTRKIKTEIARTGETVNETETEIVIVVATTATRTRTGNGTGIATVSVNGIGTETMTVGEGSTTDGTITMTVIGLREITGIGITVTGRRSTTRTMTGTSGGSITSIGMMIVGRRAGARGNALPRRSVMRGLRR